jgi:hypothetical protein
VASVLLEQLACWLGVPVVSTSAYGPAVSTPPIVPWLALVLSVVALGWQAWSWFRSGPVLRVVVAGVTILEPSLVGDPPPEQYVQITVANKGRVAVTVRSFGIALPNKGNLYAPQQPRFADDLPARIEPHASASFYMLAEEVLQYSAKNGVPLSRMRPWVETAAGRKVYSRKPIPVA